MQWSLVAVVLIVNALFGASCASAENGKGQISSVFEAFGYSPACVASALTSCEFSSTKELSVDVVDSIEATKSLLQEMKSEIKAIRQEMKSTEENSSSVVKILLQEMKSEREISTSVLNFLLQEMKSDIKAIRQEKSAEENSSSVVKSLLQEMKSERESSMSEIKAIRQEMKSAEANSTSVVKSLLQEMKSERESSMSEIKAIRQEMKSAEANSTSVVKSLLQEMKSDREISVSEIKAIRQEIQSEGENSSSVVKSLLQEMHSEIGNSGSEMKAIRQEMKSAEENSSSVVKNLLQEINRHLENFTDSFQSRDCAIPSGTTAAPEEKELPKNCAELKEQGETSSGVQTVYPYGSLYINPKPTTVFCDQVTDGGGWTVIQSRSPLPIRENFQRNWDDYVKGFGDLNGEFWIGLDNIHALTNSAKMALRIDLEAADGGKAFALYSTFHVGDAASKYVLRIGGYSGNAGDGMTPSVKDWNVNNMKFSTHDNDNDLYSGGNCAKGWKGGWWFNHCFAAKLNGLPIVGEAPNHDGIHWTPFRGWPHSLKKASMRIRPVSLGF